MCLKINRSVKSPRHSRPSMSKYGSCSLLRMSSYDGDTQVGNVTIRSKIWVTVEKGTRNSQIKTNSSIKLCACHISTLTHLLKSKHHFPCIANLSLQDVCSSHILAANSSLFDKKKLRLFELTYHLQGKARSEKEKGSRASRSPLLSHSTKSYLLATISSVQEPSLALMNTQYNQYFDIEVIRGDHFSEVTFKVGMG